MPHPGLYMPAQQKKVVFCIAGVFSFACALGIAAAIGTQLWIQGKILCKTGALLVNATGQELDKFIGEIQYGLFYGEWVRQCGLGGRPFQFSWFVLFGLQLLSKRLLFDAVETAAHFTYTVYLHPLKWIFPVAYNPFTLVTHCLLQAIIEKGLISFVMLNKQNFGRRIIIVFPDLFKIMPASIHVSVILFCLALFAFALIATGFFMYNAFGTPYEPLHGPLGLYLWSFISVSCGFLILILFSSEVKIHHLSEKIANYKEGSFIFKTHSEQFAKSFWIILVCSLVHFMNILLIRLAGFEFPFSKSKDSEAPNGAMDLMY